MRANPSMHVCHSKKAGLLTWNVWSYLYSSALRSIVNMMWWWIKQRFHTQLLSHALVHAMIYQFCYIWFRTHLQLASFRTLYQRHLLVASHTPCYWNSAHGSFIEMTKKRSRRLWLQNLFTETSHFFNQWACKVLFLLFLQCYKICKRNLVFFTFKGKAPSSYPSIYTIL